MRVGGRSRQQSLANSPTPSQQQHDGLLSPSNNTSPNTNNNRKDASPTVSRSRQTLSPNIFGEDVAESILDEEYLHDHEEGLQKPSENQDPALIRVDQSVAMEKSNRSSRSEVLINKFSRAHTKIKTIEALKQAGKRAKRQEETKHQQQQTKKEDHGKNEIKTKQQQHQNVSIEDAINEKIELEDIKQLFEDSDDAGLKESEFIHGLSQLLGPGRQYDEFKALFARIDANSNGRIDWNEFSTYVLLGYEGAKKMKNNNDDALYVQTAMNDVNTKNMHHKGMINRIVWDEKRDRYYTSAYDGLVKSWCCGNLMYDRTIYYTTNLVTDMMYLPVTDELCVCGLDRVVTFYDLDDFSVKRAFKGRQAYSSIGSMLNNSSPTSLPNGASVTSSISSTKSEASELNLSRKEFIEVFMPNHLRDPNPLIENLDLVPPSQKVHKQIEKVKNEFFPRPFNTSGFVNATILEEFIHVPTCATDVSNYFSNRVAMKENLKRLSMGISKADFVGSNDWNSNAMELSSACWILFGLDAGYVQLYDCSGAHGFRTADSIKPEKKWKLHDGWITKIINVPIIDSIITSSLDKTISVVNMEDTKKTRSLLGHSKGVYSIDYNERYRLVASCGHDKQVKLWNPFIQKALVTMSGHERPIIDVKFNIDDRQIISVDSGKTIKIWDMRNYKCIQTLEDDARYRPRNEYSALYFSEKTSSILTASPSNGRNHSMLINFSNSTF